ncbi:MAG: FecR family protein [Deltaproteobacteria bacterium]|nr:FecR family protein [Deltaproteobacteria bacterium]
MKNISRGLTIGLALFLMFFLSSSLTWAQDGPVVLRVAGTAQILEAGRHFEAKEGHRLSPGQSVKLIGGGEVLLSVASGKIAIKVLENSTAKYDGPTGANDRPWSNPVGAYQKASTTAGKKVPQLSVPVGKLEVEVQPGQELRVVCPLIMAAVRGTRFTVTVDLDGTSRVDTFEGQVAAYGRDGEIRLTLAGQKAEVTARDYTAHLAANGVRVPQGGWRNVPAQSRENVDERTLGVIFGPDGGDLLTAVLANPNASPTSGLNAIAIESSSTEPGSLFVEDFGSGDLVGGETRIQPLAAAIEPESTLLDQGLPDIHLDQGLSDIKMPYSPSEDNRHGTVIGSFSLPGATEIDANMFVFDLDFGTGAITNAGFNVIYTHPHSVYTTASTDFGATGGTGSLNLATLHFTISNFGSSHSEYSENMRDPSASQGHLGDGTVMSGSFASPLDFSGSLSGQLTPVYIPDMGYSAPTSEMPLALNFAGSLHEKPLYTIEGHFTPPGSTLTVSDNWYFFSLNVNDGSISDGDMGMNYQDASGDVRVFLRGGSGSMTSSSFNVNFPRGEAESVSASYFGTATGTLNGVTQHDLDHTVVGTQVTGGSVSISYSGAPPAYMPTTLTIDDGEVIKAGAP